MIRVRQECGGIVDFLKPLRASAFCPDFRSPIGMRKHWPFESVPFARLRAQLAQRKPLPGPRLNYLDPPDVENGELS